MKSVVVMSCFVVLATCGLISGCTSSGSSASRGGESDVLHFDREREKGWYTVTRQEDGAMMLDGAFRVESWPFTVAGEYKSGLLHGTMRSTAVAGGGFVHTFKQGMLDGLFQIFDEDGSVSTEGSYSEGMRDGVWTYRDDDGEVIRTETYQEGRLVE